MPYDLSAGLRSSTNELIPKTRSGRIRVTLKFDRTLEEAITCLIYCEYQCAISFDKNGKIELSYDSAGGS